MISIIIPMFNAEKTILPLLESIDKQNFKDFEVIIVDDCSNDNSPQIVKDYQNSYQINFYTMETNSGPATARNFGVKKAKGDVLFFLDSDLYIENNALQNIDNFFQALDAKCMIGVYSKTPAEPGALAYYKSLQNYYNYTIHKENTVTFFWGAFGAVRKDVFEEIGDFDTSYKKAEYEDYDFGRRVLKKYPIHLRRDVIVRHYFSNSLSKNFKDHFRRSGMWLNIFFQEKKFDNYVTTKSHGLGKTSGTLAILTLPLIFYKPVLALIPIILFMVYFLLNCKFFTLAFKEKGLIFFFKTIIFDLIFSIAINLGVGVEFLKHALRLKKSESQFP